MKHKLALALGLLLCFSLMTKSQTITSVHFRISDTEKGIRSVELNINNTFIIGISANSNISYVHEAEEAHSANASSLEYNDDDSKLIANQKIEYYDHLDNSKSGKVNYPPTA